MHRKGKVMEILVVTGGIGSGKSEVCRILQQEYGCAVYNADQRVKLLYDSHPTLLTEIEHMLGASLRDADRKFVPAKLSERIFADKEILLKVEGLVFPALTDDFVRWSREHVSERFVVFESATILEKPQLKGFGDKTVIVDSSVETRLERACRRDSATRESISARMRNQKLMNSISEGETEADVDAVIRNDGSLDDLRVNTVKVIEKLF